jgi:competence protein ComEC
VGAFLVTAPIVAHHFEVIAPVSIIAGVPAIPLTSLALIGVASALIFDPLLPPVASLLASGTGAAIDLLDWIAKISAEMPYGSGPIARPPWWSWTVATSIGLGAAHAVRASGRRLRYIVGTGSTIATLVVWPILTPDRRSEFEIHFLDVGQGDAIAIRTPEDRWVLVDTGPASSDFDAGARRVVPFLQDRGARRIEALVLTHPDLDHIGGAAAVLDALPVGFVFEPGLAVGKDSYVDLLGVVDSTDTEWRAARSGRTLRLDGATFDFLWPDPEFVDAGGDANQISAVLRVTYRAFTMLLTGDAGTEIEQRLVDRHDTSLRALMLKLGHHGSETSTGEEFLDIVQPEIVIVSAGRRNRYGHPAPAVMDRVTRRGIPVARTDLEGTISFSVSEDGSEWRRQDP